MTQPTITPEEMGRAMTMHAEIMNAACRAGIPFTLLDFDINTNKVTYHAPINQEAITSRFTDPAYLKAERAVARVERSIRRNVR